jgi:hypothetical protein
VARIDKIRISYDYVHSSGPTGKFTSDVDPITVLGPWAEKYNSVPPAQATGRQTTDQPPVANVVAGSNQVWYRPTTKVTGYASESVEPHGGGGDGVRVEGCLRCESGIRRQSDSPDMRVCW